MEMPFGSIFLSDIFKVKDITVISYFI